MSYKSLNEVLEAFIETTYEKEVRTILANLGDSSELGIDQEFGSFKLCWHPFGNNPSNISTVNLATKPGRSLTERLTNADDASLEERSTPGVSPPRSPREAAKQWFGRPVSGPDDGLFNWDYAEAGYDKRIAVIVNPSGIEAAPTIDVTDDGIGLKPEQFPSTILSLQSGNKIQKWYLIGAFGQGGASTLAFCEYALIVSRPRLDPKTVGFTVVKVLRLSELYKEDTYAYLALKPAEGTMTVPSCQITQESMRVPRIDGRRIG